MQLYRNISIVFNFALLIITFGVSNSASGQVQSGSASGNGLNSPVYYEARDSIVANLKEKTVRLYGASNVKYEDISLTAELIEIDLETNEIIATYALDSLGNQIGKPIFNADGEESECDYIKYNIDTKKGFVKEVRMTQGEGYIHMAESKIQPNEEIHFKNGKFTTCDKEVPHYHFNLSRAIVIPDKRIVTGPVYMEILNVPTPLAAPFGFFPNSETKKAGIILPHFQNSNRYGFGLEGLGYYIPLGAYWETYFYGSIYTTGSWALQNVTNYYQKYKYRGGFGLKFEQFRGKFYDTTPTINKWTVNWTHTQDPKSHPTLKFNSNINFVSDNNAKTSLEAINQNYFNNTFNSSVNVTKSWRTSRFNGTMGLQSSLQQNSQSQNYSLELPRYNLSVSRFDLGTFRKSAVGSSSLDKITVTYNMNARNFIQAPDSIFNATDANLIGNYARNGLEHKLVVQFNKRIAGGRFTFTPSANYREIWNFQYQQREWNLDAEKVDTADFKGFKTSRDVAFSGSLLTNLYGYYLLKGKQQMKFRHVASPTVSFTFQPDIGLYESIQVDTTGKTAYYSPFSESLYRESAQGSSGRINFDLNNTIEMKKRDKNDTINGTFKSYKLVDALSVRGSYDFMKDSLKLSNLSLAFRTSRFFNIFSFQSNASLSPYAWVDSTGITINQYAWNAGKGIGRIQSAQGILNANFTNKKGRAQQKDAAEKADFNAKEKEKVTNPQFKDYSIPWVLNFAYNIDYRRSSSSNGLGSVVDTFSLVQTIRADGNVNLNDTWKIDFNANYSFSDGYITNFNIGLWRDLHCWQTSLLYQQFGRINPEGDAPSNWAILFKIGVKATMFQDIKYDHTFTNPNF